MDLIVKRLITTLFSAGVFVLIASAVSVQPSATPTARARAAATTTFVARRPVVHAGSFVCDNTRKPD